MTAAPKTVAFGAGTLLRQSSKPSPTGGIEGGLEECRGLRRSVKGLPVINGYGSTGTQAPSYLHPWQPWPPLNKQPSVFTSMEGGKPPRALDAEGRILAPREPAKRV